MSKGTRVLVDGQFKTREYEKDGQKRLSVEVNAEDVAVSLRWATAKVQRMSRSGSGNAPSGGSGDDPWARQAAPSSQGSFDSEPPF